MEGPTLLTLKVMRVSRPELASAWQPFYSSSPSFSAHSTASIVSLQGTTPLPGHPKTLRDLTHASEILALPSSFGSIQLGETFSSCLCVNNEAQFDVEAMSLRVEMQTATAKVVLAEYGGPDHTLAAGKTFENVVHHEIKELGQHVLACAVTYRHPSHSRQSSGPGENSEEDPSLQTFRKFYKFAVTNPLSVKTKVHVPKSPSALLSRAEREKVFLEVHIQNLTQTPMYFERVQFECVDGWEAEDVNLLDDKNPLFSGPQALMQPQDTRQYIYIFTPKYTSLLPPTLPPGSVVPLGRLDIFWRSSFGEPGRLLTSMLSRRIPIPPPMQTPGSALPPYLKRTVTHGPPSRPQSPHANQSQPDIPPPRSGSSSRPQSPFQPPVAPPPELEVGLLIRDTPRDTLRVDKPFTLPLTLVLSTTRQPENEKSHRIVQIIVQHLQAPRVSVPSTTPAPRAEMFSPHLPSSGFSTPSSVPPTFSYAVAHQKLAVVASPRQRALSVLEGNLTVGNNDTPSIPPPYSKGHDEFKLPPTVLYVGSSVLRLPPIELFSEPEVVGQIVATQDFELTYLPTRKGFATVGGLRILLTDKFVDESYTGNVDSNSSLGQARTLKEWDVIAEIWVSP
ncbi:UPF0533 protein C5orf44 [Termitomyces sp. T112]|nr:UPF0533 protein C5orf44 [Termitomyces sp. T112]KAH0584117.1 hypothetical protein H2248_009686 [Termitomyces sp. 'cryptogamus']